MRRHHRERSPMLLSNRQAGRCRIVHSAVPVGGSVTALAVVAEGAGAGAGAGLAAGASSGATVEIVAGVGAGVGVRAGAAVAATLGFAVVLRFAAALRAGGRFSGFVVRAAVRLATFFLALVAPFFDRAADFSTRFFVLLFDFALLLGLADRLVLAVLAIRMAPCCVGSTAPTVAGAPRTCETHCSSCETGRGSYVGPTFRAIMHPARSQDPTSAAVGNLHPGARKCRQARSLRWSRAALGNLAAARKSSSRRYRGARPIAE